MFPHNMETYYTYSFSTSSVLLWDISILSHTVFCMIVLETECLEELKDTSILKAGRKIYKCPFCIERYNKYLFDYGDVATKWLGI